MNSEKKIMVAVVAAVLGTLVIAGGYGTREEVVDQCESTSSKWVLANYSATDSGIDFDGEFYSETSYWHAPASPVFEAKTLDGKLHSVSHAFTPRLVPEHGYFTPPVPQHDAAFSRDVDFDNFSTHYHRNLRVRTQYEGAADHFDSDIAGTRKCVGMLGKAIAVKTWYGISYNTNWTK